MSVAYDFCVKIRGQFWPVFCQPADAEVPAKEGGRQIDVDDGYGDVVAVATTLLSASKSRTGIEAVVSLGTDSQTSDIDGGIRQRLLCVVRLRRNGRGSTDGVECGRDRESLGPCRCNGWQRNSGRLTNRMGWYRDGRIDVGRKRRTELDIIFKEGGGMAVGIGVDVRKTVTTDYRGSSVDVDGSRVLRARREGSDPTSTADKVWVMVVKDEDGVCVERR